MKLIILDRDGVINYDSKAFIKSPDEWQAVPGSLEAIARLHRAAYQIVIISNQSGVGRGLFSLETLFSIHDKMIKAVKAQNGKIAHILFCPHHPDEACHCRKPKTAMFEQALKMFDAKAQDVWAIGDSLRDLEAAQSIGCKPLLVRTGNGRALEPKLPEHLSRVAVFDDLAHATEHLLGS